MFNRWFNSIVTFGLTIASTHIVYAGQAIDTVTVTTNITPSCVIQSIDHLDFGNYVSSDPQPKLANAAITVQCIKGTQYTIYIDANRKMTFSGHQLDYQLFSNSSYTKSWGNDLGTGEQFDSSDIQASTHIIYGKLPAGQNVPAGLYSNTNTVYLEW